MSKDQITVAHGELVLIPLAAQITGHTYATASLMAWASPAYIALQMGHRNAKMLFTVYGKWIERADRGRERGKVNSAFSLGSSDSVRVATS